VKKVEHELFEKLLTLIFAPQKKNMDYRQQEYQEELQKVQDRDFTHNWVSSSAFIFYLSIAILVAFAFGTCYQLYSKRFEKSGPKQEIVVQPSSKFTPEYK
jgi:hypothetical protein